MPGYNSNPGHSEEDMYSDGGDDAPESKGQKEEQEQEAVTEIPKSVMGGKEFNVGDEIVLKIVKKTEGGALVSYAPAKKGEGEGSEDYSEGEGEGDSEYSSMME